MISSPEIIVEGDGLMIRRVPHKHESEACYNLSFHSYDQTPQSSKAFND